MKLQRCIGWRPYHPAVLLVTYLVTSAHVSPAQGTPLLRDGLNPAAAVASRIVRSTHEQATAVQMQIESQLSDEMREVIRHIRSKRLHSPRAATLAQELQLAKLIHQAEHRMQSARDATQLAAEQLVAGEVKEVEDKMATARHPAGSAADARTAQHQQQEVVAGEITEVEEDLHRAQSGAGSMATEQELAREIKQVETAMETARSGGGNLAVEREIAGEVKDAAADMVASGSPDSSATIQREETWIGGIIDDIARKISPGETTGGGDGSGDDSDSKTAAESPEDDRDDDDDDDSDRAAAEDADEGPADSDHNSVKADVEHDGDTYEDAFIREEPDDDLRPAADADLRVPAVQQSRVNTPSEDTRQLAGGGEGEVEDTRQLAGGGEGEVEDPPGAHSASKVAGAHSWQVMALTVALCAVVGTVMLVVVGTWFRQMSFRSGLPEQLMVDDDEDTVYNATTRPSSTVELGRYSRLK